MFLPYEVTGLGGMIANASVLMLIVRFGLLKPITNALAAVGRTAFSNYIMTSLICQFYFDWGPWKAYGTLEYYQELYVVAAIWILNVAFSVIWLGFFQFGPLEWLWRSLSYWNKQQLRLRHS